MDSVCGTKRTERDQFSSKRLDEGDRWQEDTERTEMDEGREAADDDVSGRVGKGDGVGEVEKGFVEALFRSVSVKRRSVEDEADQQRRKGGWKGRGRELIWHSQATNSS